MRPISFSVRFSKFVPSLYQNSRYIVTQKRVAVAVIKKLSFRCILSLVALNLSSCAWQLPRTVTISSGSDGSGYQRISQQISLSAQSMGDLTVEDAENSQGSLQNLERLLNKEVDFAIVQLDVVSEAMKEGKVKTVVILTQEYLHLVTRKDSGIKTFADLKGKRVAVGAPGSGIYFTANRIFGATDLDIVEINSNNNNIAKLGKGEIDAFVYVGPLGTNERVRKTLKQTNNLQFIPVESHLTNYLTIQYPESYRSAIIPQGTYKPFPELPQQDLPTISTPGALITRPDVNSSKVSLLTWAIISNIRQFSAFYPEFASEKGKVLVNKGLTHVHPAAQSVFTQGDPRNAWLRYIQENKPLQAASIMLLVTSTIGFSLRWWRQRRYKTLLINNRQAISELRGLLETEPQKASEEIERLRQQYRLMLIDGTVPTEAYEQIERMTQIFADECRTGLEKQQQNSIKLVLESFRKWQESCVKNPQDILENLYQDQQKYLEMLLAKQITMPTYLQLTQLTLSWGTLCISASQNLSLRQLEQVPPQITTTSSK